MLRLFRKIRLGLFKKPTSSLGRYLFYTIGETALVVIGILIALNINNWNQDKQNKLAEQNYLKEMLEDFESNFQQSNKIIGRLEAMLPILTELLEQSALEKPTLTVDSLNKAFTIINDMPSYSSTDRVYNNLIGSGDLKLILNNELKTNLAEYYKMIYVLKLVQTTHEMELVESFQPYIIEYMDFQAIHPSWIDDYSLPPPVEKNKILEVISDRKFRNVLTLKWVITTDLLDQNRGVKEINIKIINHLKVLTEKQPQ